MARSVLLFLLVPVALLLILGLVMQGSISPVMRDADKNGPYFHLIRQFGFVALGLLAMILASLWNYDHWRRLIYVFYFGAMALLIMCYLPVVGVEINGASRWVKVGLQIQPSEIAKLIGVLSMAAWCHKYGAYQKTFFTGFFYPMAILGGLALLIAGEVDLGNAALVGLAGLSVLFVAGSRLRYLLAGVLLAVTLGAAIIAFVPAAKERIGRITSFFNPDSEARIKDGSQQHQSLRALGAGGDNGLGLGNSVEKSTLPFANSDFIFPIVGEEMGIAATMGVLLAYACLALGGILVSIHASDSFGRLAAFGITVLIISQAMLHIGVSLNALPNKGAALPFVSAGGTGLVTLMFSVGILCSIYRRAGALREGLHRDYLPSSTSVSAAATS